MLPLSNSKSIFQDFFIGSMRLQNLPSAGSWPLGLVFFFQTPRNSTDNRLEAVFHLTSAKYVLNSFSPSIVHSSIIHFISDFQEFPPSKQLAWPTNLTHLFCNIQLVCLGLHQEKKHADIRHSLGRFYQSLWTLSIRIFNPTKIQPFLRKICMVST